MNGVTARQEVERRDRFPLAVSNSNVLSADGSDPEFLCQRRKNVKDIEDEEENC